MPRLAYHILARRADAEKYTVHLTMDCPLCDNPIAVRVEGNIDVVITDACEEKCHTLSYYPWSSFLDSANERAQGERDDYRRHLADGGM